MTRRSWWITIAVLAAAQVTLLFVVRHVDEERAGRDLPVTMERRSEPGRDLVVERPDGSRVAVAARSGGYQLVHFWATWCPPCVKEIPSLSALARRDPERLRVWAVSTDPEWGIVENFFRGEIPGYVVRDPGGAARAYTVRGLPDSYLLDPGGRVVARFAGGQDWTSDEMRRVLDGVMVGN